MTIPYSVSLFVFLGAEILSATPLPQNYNLSPAEERPNEFDAELATWFKDYVQNTSPLDLAPPAFEKDLANHDPLTVTYLKLRYADLKSKDEDKILLATIAEIKKIDGLMDANKAQHPLLPYLLAEILQNSKTNTEDASLMSLALIQNGAQSCPQKGVILKELNENFMKNQDVERLRIILNRIAVFRSQKFQEEALEAFLYSLPQERQEDLRAELFERVKDFPKLIEDNVWLYGPEGKPADKANNQTKEPFDIYKAAGDESRSEHCRTARITLEKAIKKSNGSAADHFESATNAAGRVENCFRRKGTLARIKYWQQMELPLKDVFGFKGSELVRRKLGSIYWSNDDFDKAREYFNGLQKEAAELKQGEIEANALYTLARIEENHDNLQGSLEFYAKYIEKFPQGEKLIDVLMASAMLNTILKQFDKALVNVNQILAHQSKLAVDARSSAGMSFALFWAGRLHYALGNQTMAVEMWRTVASEYYSTFYGALGHYLSEKVNLKFLKLEPSRSGNFDKKALYSSFDSQGQMIIGRVETLLKLGLREEASCEIAELEAENNTREKTLVKSLLQNAAGDWLASIKNYDKLDRSFRHSLPTGFERLLFPRAYEGSVLDYSKRLSIDPDFIFAIIRQESVFNPKARSSAGAKGLMQLMPQTAILESRRLAKGYLPPYRRTQISRSATQRGALFDAETNLAIGVHHVYRLLKLYGNPVHVLTTYNANPRATAKWREKFPSEDVLTFIERIPYMETRQYVKFVMRNYFYYKRWYKSPAEKMPHLDEIADSIVAMGKTPKKPG